MIINAVNKYVFGIREMGMTFSHNDKTISTTIMEIRTNGFLIQTALLDTQAVIKHKTSGHHVGSMIQVFSITDRIRLIVVTYTNAAAYDLKKTSKYLL